MSLNKISLFVLICVCVSGLFLFKKESKSVKLVDVKYHQVSQSAKKQIDCLAKNIYYESVGESFDGQLAVGMVTMNRVVSGDFARLYAMLYTRNIKRHINSLGLVCKRKCQKLIMYCIMI